MKVVLVKESWSTSQMHADKRFRTALKCVMAVYHINMSVAYTVLFVIATVKSHPLVV